MQCRCLLSVTKSCIGLGLLVCLLPALALCDVSDKYLLNSTENLTVRAVFANNTPVLGASALIDIYKEGVPLIMQDSLIDDSNGFYHYELNDSLINETGIYTYYINISSGSFYDFPTGVYEIVPELPDTQLSNITALINNATSPLYGNIWNYTDRTLTIDPINYETVAQYVWNHTMRTLSYDGIYQLARAVWTTVTSGPRSVDSVPIATTVQTATGPRTIVKPSSDLPSCGRGYDCDQP